MQYDIFFQDDGGHSLRYAPYSANSGFYFVRYNDRTRHFLTALLMAGGDMVISTKSHQQALIALLQEHVSLHGLKAKVLSRDMEYIRMQLARIECTHIFPRLLIVLVAPRKFFHIPRKHFGF